LAAVTDHSRGDDSGLVSAAALGGAAVRFRPRTRRIIFSRSRRSGSDRPLYRPSQPKPLTSTFNPVITTQPVLFRSLAVLDPKVGHTVDALSPLSSVIPIDSSTGSPVHALMLSVRAWRSSSPACTWHCSLRYRFLAALSRPEMPPWPPAATPKSGMLRAAAVLSIHAFLATAIRSVVRLGTVRRGGGVGRGLC